MTTTTHISSPTTCLILAATATLGAVFALGVVHPALHSEIQQTNQISEKIDNPCACKPWEESE
ncbi:MAG: hypothetical protein COA43_01195 [Robiginitomaculum sp.]|nr:MAG: hypothetical protein COA43_01195 [Robiginitomaculum sp.]